MDNNKGRRLSYNKYYRAYKIRIPKYITELVYNACKDNEKYKFTKSETELAIYCLLFEILRTLKDNMFVKLHGFGIFKFRTRDLILTNIEKDIVIYEDLKFISLKFSYAMTRLMFKELNKDNMVYNEHLKDKIEKRKTYNGWE